MPELVTMDTTAKLPANYIFVSVDIDTTGKRLIDEIIQLSAYTPEKQFSQYVMPYMNLNQAAKMKHQVRVINIGIFRMLKNMQTHKVIKTASEYVALTEFMNWLEALKQEKKDSKGIVLVFHEQRQFIPCMLLSSLNKYNLLDRFSSIIVGFGNNYCLAERKGCQPFKYLSLTQLAKMLLGLSDEEEKCLFEGNASVRAKLAYEIFHHLLTKPSLDENGDEVNVLSECFQALDVDPTKFSSIGEEDGAGGEDSAERIKALKAGDLITKSKTDVIMNVANSLTILAAQQDIIKRQNSLRPIFVNYFRGKIFHRLLAVECRRSLAEYGYDLDKLQSIWDEKKMEGINTVVDELNLVGEKKTELIKIIDAHFDPEKSPLRPARTNNSRRDFRHRSSKNFPTNSSSSSAVGSQGANPTVMIAEVGHA